MAEYRVQVIEKRVPIGQRQAAMESFQMVVLLDCWPVNLSEEIKKYVREKYPFMRIRYIPAGLTGGYQINDSYLHGPLKSNLRRLAEAWYAATTLDLLKKLENKEITECDFHARQHSMFSIVLLRDKSVQWVIESLKLITARDQFGNNVILKGWHDTFGPCFKKDFQDSTFRKYEQKSAEEALNARMDEALTHVAAEEESRNLHAVPTEPTPKPGKPKKPKKTRALRHGVAEYTTEEKQQRTSVMQAQTERSMAAAMQSLSGSSSATPMVTSAPSVSNPARAATAKPRAKPTPPKAPRAKRCASSPASEEDEDGEAEGDDDDDDSGSDESGESQDDGPADRSSATIPSTADPGPRAHLRRHARKSAAKPGVSLADTRRDSYHAWRNLTWMWPEVLFLAGQHGTAVPRVKDKIQGVLKILQELEIEASEQDDEPFVALFLNYRSVIESWAKGEGPQPDRDFFNTLT